MLSDVTAATRSSREKLVEAIGGLRIHDHLCLIYKTTEEQFAAVIPFMGIGLERGEKCVYIADENTSSSVLDAMKAEGVDTAEALKSGALSVITKKEAYLREGYFHPDMMICFLAENIAAARAEGFSGLRATGEMTWALGGEIGVERLLEYESKLNSFFPENDIVAICQYNRNRFTPEIIRDIILTHPLVIHGDKVCRNLYFVPPDEFLAPGQVSREVERLLRNIREAEEAEEALCKSEERFRRLAENARDVIYRMSLPDGNYEYMSPSAAEIFGYGPEEFYSSPQLIHKVIHPDWHGYFEDQWSRLLRGDMPPTYEYQIIHKSGEVRWLNQRNILIRDDGGRIVAIEGIVTDMTARKRAEEALCSEKAQLRCLIDTPSDLIFIKDREGSYLGCNRASEEFVGMPECEQIGKTDFDFFDRERAETIREIDRRVLTEGKPLRIEDWVTNRDGARVPLDTLKAPYYALDGQVLGLVGICRDITEQKRAEEQLMLANAYNRSLIEASLDPLVTIGHDGRITDVNAATERVTGFPREELIGTDFSAYFTDPEKADAGYQLVFREGMVHDYELEIRHRHGHVTPVLYNASIYRDGTGNAAGVFAAARDISERRNLENQLRQSQKMEAVGTLAGGIAHEFNNIMTAVIGYGSLLRMKLAEDAKLLPKVDALLQAADRAAVLVRSLLSFSLKQGMELKSLDLNELISREGEMLRRVIREDIELHVSPADSLLAVKADYSQIDQVLVNLANNAQDAMPKGGEITISTASVELERNFLETHGFGEPGRYAVITFSDNGEGMEEEIRQKVFEPFFTTREVGKGTGLGLSICYGIIKQHKGYIICESEPGKGTVFTIYLPMIAVEAR